MSIAEASRSNSKEKSLEEMFQEINALLNENETPDIANPQPVRAAPTAYLLSELDASGIEAIEGENATQRLQDLTEIAELPGLNISQILRFSNAQRWENILNRLSEAIGYR